MVDEKHRLTLNRLFGAVPKIADQRVHTEIGSLMMFITADVKT